MEIASFQRMENQNVCIEEPKLKGRKNPILSRNRQFQRPNRDEMTRFKCMDNLFAMRINNSPRTGPGTHKQRG